MFVSGEATSKWGQFSLPTLDPNIEKLAQEAENAIDAIISALEILRSALQALAALELINLSAFQAIIKAAIAAIEAIIQSFLEDTGVYMLFVPVRKQVVVAPVVVEALAASNRSVVSFVEGVSKYAYVGDALVPLSMTADNPELRGFLNSYGSSTGGNAGFFRTVAESLSDQGDLNRPQLDENAAVCGITVVGGAADYLSLLNLIMLFRALIGLPENNNVLAAPEIPVPKNLRAKVAAHEKTSDIIIRLDWDTQVPTVSLTAYKNADGGTMAATVTRTAILRSESPTLLGQHSPAAIFGTAELSVGMAVGAGYDKIEVIDIKDFAPGVSTYYWDDSGSLEKNKTYYYAASYEIRVSESYADALLLKGSSLGYWGLSNVVRVTYTNKVNRSALSKPPDWIRTPRVIDVFPDFARIVDEIVSFLESIGDFTTGFLEVLKIYIKWLDEEIQRWERWLARILSVIKRLIALLAMNVEAGVSWRAWSGIGGNRFFLADLAKSLSNKEDPYRPPYDRGDEFVMGLVLMAGAPTLNALQPVLKMLELFFGAAGTGEQAIVTRAIDALKESFEANRSAVDEAQDILVAATRSALTAASVIGDEDEHACVPSEGPVVIFGDDLSVVFKG